VKTNFILANLFRFVVFVLFTFMVLVYVGLLVVLPLDVLAQVVRLLSVIGLPTILAMAGGLSALGYLGYQVYRMPELYRLVFDIGRQLVTFGRDQMRRFDPLIEAARGNTIA
jgi:hypothetical protein